MSDPIIPKYKGLYSIPLAAIKKYTKIHPNKAMEMARYLACTFYSLRQKKYKLAAVCAMSAAVFATNAGLDLCLSKDVRLLNRVIRFNFGG